LSLENKKMKEGEERGGNCLLSLEHLDGNAPQELQHACHTKKENTERNLESEP